jgi:hypothetical protein
VSKKSVQRSLVERFIEAVQKAPAREPNSVSHREAMAMAKPAIKKAMKEKNLTARDIANIASQANLPIPESTIATYLYASDETPVKTTARNASVAKRSPATPASRKKNSHPARNSRKKSAAAR